MATTISKGNCFAPIPKEKRVNILKPREYEQERVVYNLIPKAQKVTDNDGVQQDIVVFEPVFIKKYNINEYIKSFEDDVGIQNILRKVALTGDRTLLNQTGRIGECPDGGLEDVKDYTNVPGSKTEAFNAVVAGVEAYDKLPADMKAKMSFEQFAQEFGEEQMKAYVNALVEKYNSTKEEKKGE